MKKIVIGILLALSLVACSGKEENNQAQTNDSPVTVGDMIIKTDTPPIAEQYMDTTDLQDIQKRGVLRVGVKVDVPNFGFYDPDTREMQGMEIDLARQIAYDIFGDGNAVSFQGVTAQTRGALVDNDEVDMVIATFTIKEERKKLWNFSEPYFVDEIAFLSKRSDHFTTIEDLDGKRIGVAQSATTKDALQEKAEELGISFIFNEYSGYPDLKLALTANRIDAFCVDKSILFGYVDENTEILDYGFNPQEYGIATKKTKTGLADYINAFLAAKKEDGTMQTIFERWSLVSAE